MATVNENVKAAAECLMEALPSKDQTELSAPWFLRSPARLRMAETERTLDPDERVEFAAELILSASRAGEAARRLLDSMPRTDAVHFAECAAKWLEEQKGN